MAPPELKDLGRYQVIRRIAKGGMAEILLAKAQGVMGFERQVAIKLIHRHLMEDAEFVKMFIDEARIAMHLHHGNIVQVLDLDQANGTYFIAMEYIHGVDLHEAQRRTREQGKKLSQEVAIYVMSEACRGLHFAHTRKTPDGQPMNIVHRDISPHNIMMSFEGEVKVTDFGIAKAASRLTATNPGVVKGKYSYMAPEVFRNEPVDARADVFALGVVLYELLVGQNPFESSSPAETIAKVIAGDVPKPTDKAPINKQLEEIVLTSLANRPEERYASAHMLGKDLTDFGMQLTRGRNEIASGAETLSSLLVELFPERLQASAAVKPAEPARSPVVVSTASEVTRPPTVDHSNDASQATTIKTRPDRPMPDAAPPAAGTDPDAGRSITGDIIQRSHDEPMLPSRGSKPPPYARDEMGPSFAGLGDLEIGGGPGSGSLADLIGADPPPLAGDPTRPMAAIRRTPSTSGAQVPSTMGAAPPVDAAPPVAAPPGSTAAPVASAAASPVTGAAGAALVAGAQVAAPPGSTAAPAASSANGGAGPPLGAVVSAVSAAPPLVDAAPPAMSAASSPPVPNGVVIPSLSAPSSGAAPASAPMTPEPVQQPRRIAQRPPSQVTEPPPETDSGSNTILIAAVIVVGIIVALLIVFRP